MDERLPPAPTPFPAEHVERRVHRRYPDPSHRLVVVAREPSVGSQEDVLRHVLCALEVADHTLREAHDDPIVIAEERLEANRS